MPVTVLYEAYFGGGKDIGCRNHSLYRLVCLSIVFTWQGNCPATRLQLARTDAVGSACLVMLGCLWSGGSDMLFSSSSAQLGTMLNPRLTPSSTPLKTKKTGVRMVRVRGYLRLILCATVIVVQLVH
ncbi:hypothetical protein BU26DRAFT_161755 [Trematosphaeria pertusa]|uniref:Uncharacterized protein n=1 Tax=Trematosphaeria pertusa TaxID=390896 RepID=A0A6A6HWT5_9PLEO|nr:uncharacterized protein BU26DRAFT_161755 [Trematosphaeria pertusa]KAF2242481.1 hypothetical protein BU26DRAFT_161755 [Trematosphaeria pertusa]